jgi:hypothetical protein
MYLSLFLSLSLSLSLDIPAGSQSILEATGLKPGELKRVLYSLLLTKLLRKNPPSRNFQLSDQLALNRAFKHPRTKLNVARTMERSSTRETQTQDAQTHQQSQVGEMSVFSWFT